MHTYHLSSTRLSQTNPFPQNYPEVVGAPINDIFARVDHDKSLELSAQIKKTGHDIKDVKAVIIGHLHLDHAGGLDPFRNTGIPMYVYQSIHPLHTYSCVYHIHPH